MCTLARATDEMIRGLRIAHNLDPFKAALSITGLTAVSTVYRWTESNEASGSPIPMIHAKQIQMHSDSPALLEYLATGTPFKIVRRGDIVIDGSIADEFREIVCGAGVIARLAGRDPSSLTEAEAKELKSALRAISNQGEQMQAEIEKAGK